MKEVGGACRRRWRVDSTRVMLEGRLGCGLAEGRMGTVMVCFLGVLG